MGQPNNGARRYAENHTSELQNHVFAFETDEGVTKPIGWGISASQRGIEYMEKMMHYLEPLNATLLYEGGVQGDTGPLYEKGVPCMTIIVEDTPEKKFYFTYHHTAGDSMYMLKTEELDQNVVAIASMMYIMADLEEKMPR